MYKILSLFIAIAFISSCNTLNNPATTKKSSVNQVTIDLLSVTDDKVKVTINPVKMFTTTTIFSIPEIIPGTYSDDDYGNFIENFEAFDIYGTPLPIEKLYDNSWKITGANSLGYVTYLVNDTYDVEDTHEIFSPSGTNIAEDNFMLNLHAFVGYFYGFKETKHKIKVTHHPELIANTSLVDKDDSLDSDVFYANRYFDVIDNPILYTKQKAEKFMIGDMEIILSVHSPTNKITATDLRPNIESMMKAQKAFMGKINNNKKYAILLYLSTMDKDAGGFGALEHHTSTVVVLPEMMPIESLNESMKDVVSHEFFHIITPLSVHSQQVHYFDYNNPKMSKHLWMYEGITEYFANLFQINQKLITEDEFYARMLGKVTGSKRHDDTMSFTEMSERILESPYKENYVNVYEKGALIGMCIDVIMREKSNGTKGVLNLMQDLSKKYGVKKPFIDSQLIRVVTELSYPEVGTFLKKHVVGNTPINYNEYFDKLGLKLADQETSVGYLISKMGPDATIYLTPSMDGKDLTFSAESNSFLKGLGVQGGDVLVSVNNEKYNKDNFRDLVMKSFMSWNEGDDIKMTILRKGTELNLNGKITKPKGKEYTLSADENIPATDARTILRNAWMFN